MSHPESSGLVKSENQNISGGCGRESGSSRIRHLSADHGLPRSQTIEFSLPAELQNNTNSPDQRIRRDSLFSDADLHRRPRRISTDGRTLPRSATVRSQREERVDPKISGYGGFPSPYRLFVSLFGFFFPRLQRQLTRTTTMPRTTTLNAPYLSFDTTIGRNSQFQMLTADNLEELGGVEYRALNALLWIVGFVSVE